MMISRGSSHSTQSPTVIASPSSTELLSSNTTPPPITPVLDVKMEKSLRPFSESFNGTQIISQVEQKKVQGFEPSCTGSTIVESRTSRLPMDESFRIETITDIKAIDPEWQHDEIEEICVLSPKSKSSSLSLRPESEYTPRISIPDFDVIRFKFMNDNDPAQIYVARSHANSKLYTVKTFRRNIVSEPALLNQVRSEQACLRTVTEGNALFLPTLLRSFYNEDWLFIITDYYSGGNLQDLLARGKPHLLSSVHCQFYACEVVEAISFLHSNKIVHRNVSLENVMIDSEGHAVLSDFSAAKLLLPINSAQSSSASICGSTDYQAPEMMLGWRYDFSVDCWSFGILLCILYYGQHPFLGDGDGPDPLALMQHRILSGEAPTHPTQRIPFSEWDLVKKCLQLNPHLRATTSQIKQHAYFSEIDWSRVRCRVYDAPYVPDMGNEKSSPRQQKIFQQNFLDLKTSPTVEGDDEFLNGFCFYREEEPKVLRERSSCLTLGTSKGHIMSGDIEITSNRDCGLAGSMLSPRSGQVRSILKTPSQYFPGDFIPVSEFPEIQRCTSKASLSATPNKLRKRKSSLPKVANRSSVLGGRKSFSSFLALSSPKSSHTQRDASSPETPEKSTRHSVYRLSVSSAIPNLPDGVVQSGRGIGYSHTPQGSRSKLSLVSVNTTSCFKLFSLSNLRQMSCNRTTTPRTRTDVMQQIYGSNWSIAQSIEGRMSSITFGIPEGLGRRVDDEDIPPLPH